MILPRLQAPNPSMEGVEIKQEKMEDKIVNE